MTIRVSFDKTPNKDLMKRGKRKKRKKKRGKAKKRGQMVDTSGYIGNKFIQDDGSSSVKYWKSPYQEIKRLKKLLCYNGYYIAFLLGMTTEEEFRKISDKFIEKVSKGG